jgi:hypothetical protein
MNAHQANILIHVDETVAPGQSAALAHMLGQVAGVTQVSPTAKSHLTLVEYDPAITRASAILGRVQGQSLHAQLVGL